MTSVTDTSKPNQVVRLASLFAFAAVALGAFGAHALKARLAAHGTTEIWTTAVFYHALHAVALLVVSGFRTPPRLTVIGFALGICFFSGSLYVLAFTGTKWLGAITPVGGVMFLVGWGCLAWNGGRAGVSDSRNT